jgi:hypothetical protein
MLSIFRMIKLDKTNLISVFPASEKIHSTTIMLPFTLPLWSARCNAVTALFFPHRTVAQITTTVIDQDCDVTEAARSWLWYGQRKTVHLLLFNLLDCILLIHSFSHSANVFWMPTRYNTLCWVGGWNKQLWTLSSGGFSVARVSSYWLVESPLLKFQKLCEPLNQWCKSV